MNDLQNKMAEKRLAEFVSAAAQKVGVPGVAVGVWANGDEAYACYGVTSIDNPLPVDPQTLFVLGSVTKTYTATALMRLVAKGLVDLQTPVRHYLPELTLIDEQAAAAISVLNLLNHTAGFDWGLVLESGEGDDALSAYVAKMAELKLIAAPGRRASYSQAGYNLAGRIIEKVTGLPYERAMATLLLEPLGLAHSFFNRDEIMTRRFAVGHNPGSDGKPTVARLWRRGRGDNPGGGLVSSVTDQLRWARFHLGDGRKESGLPLLSAAMLNQMKQPTVPLRASTLGDAIGIGWFLRAVDGVRTIGHSGSANGQFAELLIVPEQDFAVVALCNAAPNGVPLNQAIVRWAMATYLGVVERAPEVLPYDEQRAQQIVGRYETGPQLLTIQSNGTELTLTAGIKPEIRAASNREMPPDYPPAPIGLLPGDGEEYLITSGGLQGQRGFFTRDQSGAVVGIDLAGRLFKRATE